MKSLMKVLPRSTTLGAGPASVLTIVAGVVLAGLNVANFLLLSSTAAKPYRDVISAIITGAGAYGVQPLFGPALTNLLHISSQVLFVVAALITAANGILSVVTMTLTAHTIIAGVLTAVGAILFGSPILNPAPTPAPASRPLV